MHQRIPLPPPLFSCTTLPPRTQQPTPGHPPHHLCQRTISHLPKSAPPWTICARRTLPLPHFATFLSTTASLSPFLKWHTPIRYRNRGGTQPLEKYLTTTTFATSTQTIRIRPSDRPTGTSSTQKPPTPTTALGMQPLYSTAIFNRNLRDLNPPDRTASPRINTRSTTQLPSSPGPRPQPCPHSNSPARCPHRFPRRVIEIPGYFCSPRKITRVFLFVGTINYSLLLFFFLFYLLLPIVWAQ
jgi:hypothetical protein